MKVKNITEAIKVKGEEDYLYNIYWTEHGPLINIPKSDAKVREYMIKWRENEPEVRLLFSRMVELVKNPTSKPPLHYPFASLVTANREGIHLNVYPPEHTSYFVYPDLLGEAR